MSVERLSTIEENNYFSELWVRLHPALLLWPLFLVAAILLPGLAAFPYPSSSAAYSDIVTSHYPNAVFLRRALLEWHVIPLWSPTILSGYPFAANPLSGLWYPPGWLALLLPLPLGFNLLVAVHLIFGGIGMYLLLRKEGMKHPAALLGGLAFEFMPKLFAHYGAGHLTLLYAIPWTPWLLWSTQKQSFSLAYTSKNQSAGHINFLSSVILALIFLADPRWGAYAGFLWILYRLVNEKVWSLTKNSFQLLESLVLQIGIAGMFAAPLILPLLEYVGLSTRANLSGSDVLSFSLPPVRLLGLFYPDFTGLHEWRFYPGAAILLLALLAFFGKKRRSQVLFWAGIAFVTMIISMGSYIPFFTSLANLPGFDLLRVPARALFLTGISLAVLAAAALDQLLDKQAPFSKNSSRRLLVALTGFVWILTLGVWALSGRLPLNFAWGALATGLAAVWIGLLINEWLPPKIWVGGLILLCLVDLGGVDYKSFDSRPLSNVLAEKQEVAQYIEKQPGYFRIYSPSYSMPQQTAAQNKFELTDGVDPLQLSAYSNFMSAASGIPVSGYSVTQPPFEGGEPENANKEYYPDPVQLGLLNVRFVLAEYDLNVPGLILRQRLGETRVYENEMSRPRAWVEAVDSTLAKNEYYPAKIDAWSPNRIQLTASGPGMLVLSEISYPGWRVWVDGREVKSATVNGLLRGVELGSGTHTILYAYYPASVFAGLGASLLAIMLLLGVKVKSGRR
jgi:hypothetical protein